MRIAVLIAAIAALSAQPVTAATWTFKIGADLTGDTYGYHLYCYGPLDECVDFLDPSFSGHLSTIIDVPAFEGTSAFDIASARDGLIDAGGLYYDVWDVRGKLTLTNARTVVGSNLLFDGSWAEGSWDDGCSHAFPCTTWNTQASAPSFRVSFLRSEDGPGPVPEPSTWAMMLIGFLGLGALLRRRDVSKPSAVMAG